MSDYVFATYCIVLLIAKQDDGSLRARVTP